MLLSPEQLTELESLAIQAATRAGEMIHSKIKSDLQLLHKVGGHSLASQVVTAVDLESQRLILETLHDSLDRFDLGLLTEESPDDSSRHHKDYFWCIDPLDGTLAFTEGAPGYSVSIALVARDGTPQIGIILDPSTNTLYHAIHQKGARKNGEAWTLAQPNPSAPLTLMIDHSFIDRAKEPAFQKQLDELAIRSGHHGTKVIDHAGAVLNACWVAEHAPALYFKLPKPNPGGGCSWDFAATTCLFQELNLPSGDMVGAPLLLNPSGDTFMNQRGILFASHPSLASAASELFHQPATAVQPHE